MGHQTHGVLLVLASIILTHALGQVTGAVSKPVGCGTSVGCFSNCNGSTCGFVVSWRQNGTTAEYTLTTSVTPSSGAWMAVGFSNDSIMKDDDVLGCATNAAGTFLSFSARTEGHFPPPMYNDTDVKLVSSKLENNVLTCTIQRPVSGVASPGRVDVTSLWTLLFASGPAEISTANQTTIHYHSVNRHFSPAQVKVSDFRDMDTNGTTSPPAVTQPPLPMTVSKPAGCGTSVGCFSNCNGSTCGFAVSWKQNGTTAEYTLTANVASNSGAWIALGFSTDNAMQDDDVLGCATNAAGTFLSFSARTGGHFPPPMYRDADVKLVSGKLENNVLTCIIQRPVSGVNSTGRVDVTNSWILLFARGSATINAANQTTINYHDKPNRFISSGPVKISEVKELSADGTTSPPAVTQPPIAGTMTKPGGCGKDFGCFSNCKGSTCGFVVSWKPSGDIAEYTLAANVALGPGAWIAVGFSTDSTMKDDDVLGCGTNAAGSFVPFSARTTGHTTPQMYNDPEVNLTSSKLEDNALTCTIRRPIKSDPNGRVLVSSSWTLLFATGSASIAANQTLMQYHGSNKYISPRQVKISDTNVDLFAGSIQYPLVKAHGSLMIVAWIFLASIGIVLARYFKPAWKGLMCSEKVWFQMHRLCMVLVLLTTAIGFIIIFVEVGEYSNIQDERQYLVGHPIIGIIVMILTLMNPIMALFRCHPGTPHRPIFNWGHWFVGTSAHVLGVLNIFFGVLLSKSNVPYYLVYILGAYVAWQIFVELLLEAITCYGLRQDRNEEYELSSGDDQKRVSSQESRGIILIKRIILVVHCIIVAVFAAVLIGLLATGKDNLE